MKIEITFQNLATKAINTFYIETSPRFFERDLEMLFAGQLRNLSYKTTRKETLIITLAMFDQNVITYKEFKG